MHDRPVARAAPNRGPARRLLPGATALLRAAGPLAAALLSAVAAPSAIRAEDGASPAGTSAAVTEPRASLAALDSPFLTDREEAVGRLRTALPAGRDLVLEAFRTGTPRHRALLASVLAADPGQDAQSLLLEALAKSTDLLERRAVREALVSLGPERIEAAKAFLSSREDSPAARAEFEVLERLARRDRVETLFLEKKSRSGATGFYKGQFEDLRPMRETAIEVLSHYVMNRVLRVPGTFPAGSYAFLHTPPFLVEPGELRDMAANALSELAPTDPGDPTSVDDTTLTMLVGMSQDLEELVNSARRRDLLRQRRRGRLQWPLPSEWDSLWDVVLVTLALARPDSDAGAAVERRVDTYEHYFRLYDAAAMLLMRITKYERAVGYYEDDVKQGLSIVLPKYNIACAYAKWSEDDLRLKHPSSAADHRAQALDALEESVGHGYADWPWMEQDRDLDAIRAEPRYAVLLAKMKRMFSPEAKRKAFGDPDPGPGKPPGAPAMDGR